MECPGFLKILVYGVLPEVLDPILDSHWKDN